MLYKKNSLPDIPDELFRSPGSEYRGTPFWAWNTELRLDELKRQIEVCKKMGLGGFHMHVRTGLTTPYLSDDFMALIKGCTEKAKQEDMLAWLYDEDRWPSGFAGGLVTKNEEFRARNLLISDTPQSLESVDTPSDSRSEGSVKGRKRLLECYDIELDSQGRLVSYKRIGGDGEAEHKKWYVYLVVHSGSSWFNNQSYVDTLNKKAIEKFVEITHERYKQSVGSEFDKTIPAIFTDEPQFTRKGVFRSSLEGSQCTMPWTDDFPDTFRAAYGFDIYDYLPELFWEKAEDEISKARYFYHDHICERFTEAFSDTIGTWCENNGIHLTGHMMEEPSLRSQTCAVGEAMRAYRSFGIPGIDMLCASFELTTAKQAQSAVNQFGREGMLSELYGVTGWDYDFRGYKLHGDWQAALGVSVRVPHLSWVAMGGEAKRDYPASISYQSPWWEEFSCIEDHFARVNAVMTRGRPAVRVGVIHPIESYWLHFGPDDLTGELRNELDSRFLSLTDWLLKGSIDFDFISESQIPLLSKKDGSRFNMGCMDYDAVIVPGCESLRSTTIDKLTAFSAAGGKLIFMGDAPTVCDGEPSSKCTALYASSEKIPYTRQAVLDALESFRTVKITENGSLTDGFIYRLRDDNGTYNLFISRACEPADKNAVTGHDLTIEVDGEFFPAVYDTSDGEIYDAEYEHKDGKTLIYATMYEYDSLLLRLFKNKRETGAKQARRAASVSGGISFDKVDYDLSEENVYLIDMCYYGLGRDTVSAEEEEILRLDNICRRKAGLPERGGSVAQPWTLPDRYPGYRLYLYKGIESEIDYDGAYLAMEKPESCTIVFNGKTLAGPGYGYDSDERFDKVIDGWWTDKDIKKVKLPPIKKGINTLAVAVPLGETTNTEWMYILGNFGVKVTGHKSVITALPDKIGFGTVTTQGLPFYGGNITYKMPLEDTGRVTVSAPEYMGALMKVSYAGECRGRIIYPPYSLTFEADKPGELEITLYGNRVNCFGPVHRVAEKGWLGPDSWRTDGDNWSYNYILRNIGIMKPPVVKIDK